MNTKKLHFEPHPQYENQVVIRFRDRAIDFSLRYQTTRRQQGYDIGSVFEFLNEYCQRLKVSTCEQMFDLYQNIREEISKNHNPRMLHRKLKKYTRDLVDLLDFDDISRYISTHPSIPYPENVFRRYEDTHFYKLSGNNRRNRTIIFEEYKAILIFAHAIQFVAPVWGEYRNTLRNLEYSTYLEYQAFDLIADSKLMHEPTVPDPEDNQNSISIFERLKRYVAAEAQEATSSGSEDNSVARLSLTLAGISSTEFENWILARILVNLSIRGVLSLYGSKHAKKSNLVSDFHKFISEELSNPKKFGGHIPGSQDNVDTEIRFKRHSESVGDEEDQSRSRLDRYMMKQGIDDGSLMVLSVASEFIENFIGRIEPTLPENYLRLCQEHIQSCEEVHFGDLQKLLVQWMLERVISAPLVETLRKPALHKCFALTQARLWYWGYPDLAALVFAEPARDQFGDPYGGARLGSRHPPSHLMDQFDRLFPYYPHWREEQKHDWNFALRSLNEVSGLAAANHWRVYAPKELIQQTELVVYLSDCPILMVPNDRTIKDMFASLMIDLVTSDQQHEYQQI